MKSFILKTPLSVLLAFQIAIAPVARAAEPGDSESLPPPSQVEAVNTPQTPLQQEWEAEANRLENGQSTPVSDPMHLVGQWAEVYDGEGAVLNRYELAQLSLERPKVSFTTMRAYADTTRRLLVIEAQSGANEQGEHGHVVARHFIPGLDIVALAQDAEMLTVVDSKGNIHTLDWGSLTDQNKTPLFRANIPVFTKVYENIHPETDLSNSHVTANYVTLGLKPFTEESAAGAQVMPRNPVTNEIQVNAGDLLVEVDGKVQGVYSRKRIHEYMALGQTVLGLQVALLTQESEAVPLMSQVLQSEEAKAQEFKDALAAVDENSMNPMIHAVLTSMGRDDAEQLINRGNDHRGYAGRENGQFLLGEWHRLYSQIQNKAYASIPEGKNGPTAQEVAHNWAAYVPVLEGKRPTAEEEGGSFKMYLILAAAISAYMATPAIIDANPALHQVALLNWVYDHSFAVLKDATYRWPLYYSTACLFAVWPITEVIAGFSGSILKRVNAFVQNATGPVARTVRDISRNWGEMLRWQRINTLGARLYSWGILGLPITAIEKLARQPLFFPALTNDINPFRTIQPDSDVGKAAGLTDPMRLGVINPFKTGADRAEQVQKQDELLARTKMEKDRLHSHAFLLAAMAVAESRGIDLATLLLTEGEMNPRLPDLEVILKDPKASADWELLTEDLERELVRLPYFMEDDVKKLDVDELRQQYSMAKTAADRLLNMDPRRKWLKQLRLKASRFAVAFKNGALNLGREQYNFQSTIYTNRFVAGQVQREFVADYLFSVYLLALVGGRADLSQPNQLAASATGHLWTTPVHLNDMAMTVNIHLIFQGARTAWVYQQIKPQEEMHYQPAENFQYGSAEVRQGFLSGVKDWTKSFFVDYDKTDVGGAMMRSWRGQLGTIQASWMLALLVRIPSQSFHDAALATVMYWTMQFWFFAWPWFFIQSGNRVYSQRFAQITDELQSARLHISMGLREPDPARSKQLLDQGVAEMRGLYEKYSSKKIDETQLSPDQRDVAKWLLDYSVYVPPAPTAPNKVVLESTSLAGAVITTLLSVPLANIVFLDTSSINLTHWFQWIGESALLTAGFYAVFSKNSINNYLHPVTFLGKLKRALFASGKTCEERLAIAAPNDSRGSEDGRDGDAGGGH